MDDNKPKIDLNGLSEWQMNRLCHALLDACKRYYSDPENMRKYEEWKASGLTKNGMKGKRHIKVKCSVRILTL